MDKLFESQVITDKILYLLDARSLARFGSTSSKWRSLSNVDMFWSRLCRLHKYERFEYLVETPPHGSITVKSATTASPVYTSSGNKPAIVLQIDPFKTKFIVYTFF